MYAWVPDIIRYYLDEEPLVPNVPTYRTMYDDERRFVIENIGDLVVKPANESGGYGIVIGDRATREELDDTIRQIEADPRNFVAQPILSLFSFRYTPEGVADDALDALNLQLVNAINDDGRIYLTQTNHDGVLAIRFVAGQFDATEDDIAGALDVITEVARLLTT